MATMHELTADYMTVLNMATDGETPPDVIADTLEAISGEIEIKAENSAVIMQELKADKIDAEIKRLTARKKAYETNADTIKDRIYNAMKTTGKEKFKTTLFSFTIGKNPVKLVIDDADKIPKKYLIPQPAKIDNAALKEELKSGKKCKYAHLEQSESLRIK